MRSRAAVRDPQESINRVFSDCPNTLESIFKHKDKAGRYSGKPKASHENRGKWTSTACNESIGNKISLMDWRESLLMPFKSSLHLRQRFLGLSSTFSRKIFSSVTRGQLPMGDVYHVVLRFHQVILNKSQENKFPPFWNLCSSNEARTIRPKSHKAAWRKSKMWGHPTAANGRTKDEKKGVKPQWHNSNTWKTFLNTNFQIWCWNCFLILKTGREMFLIKGEF